MDFLSVVIVFIMYMIYIVLEVGWFRGKVLGILICGFDWFFVILNLFFMFVILVNKYLVILYGFKYFVWKIKMNVVICIFFVWFVSIILMVLFLILFFDINFGDVYVIYYRIEIFK